MSSAESSADDQSVFWILGKLVPVASRPHVAVIVLTELPGRGVWEFAKQRGAYECFHKPHTTGEELNKPIHRAVAFVGQMPKEDQYRLSSTVSSLFSEEKDPK